MAFWLAGAADGARLRAADPAWLKRFDARHWTVDFPRPMMAAATTPAADTLRVDAVFYRTDDLAGLIWASEDGLDHPLTAYETARDYRGLTLSFRWRSGGLRALDAIHGPTLTIEGRDAEGRSRAWYVRLWNYATGTPEDAAVTLDFSALDGGFLLPNEADPVWAGDVDRLFVSLVAPGYTGAAGPLLQPAEGWAELSALRCDGAGSVLRRGQALVPPHGVGIATGFDDAYNQTPARLLEGALALGYRGPLDHYVGMSHFFRLGDDGSGALVAQGDGGALNVACAAWHRDFLARAAALGFEAILSLSFELLDQHCPEDWKQRAADGTPALTGWQPPSTLLSPACPEAVAYLRTVATAFATLARDAGVPVRVQLGEPWWWVRGDGTICLHDAHAAAALGPDAARVGAILGEQPATVQAVLDAAGALLADATAALTEAVRAVAADAELLLLAYLPTLLDPRTPEARRANLPSGWARPTFDRLQLEDYDWVLAGDTAASARGAAAVAERLGYPPDAQDYFSGFVLTPDEAATAWPRIEAALAAARGRGVSRRFVWALPQVCRDGFTRFEIGEDTMQAFDDVDFPLALGREASVAPAFSTAIVTTAAGAEQRNAEWADARLRFDAGPGVRSEADIAALLAFFRARRGAARAFRFRDPLDASSAADGLSDPTPVDQWLGDGDGVATGFPLVKRYGDAADAQLRAITRPVAGSVRVSVDGAERLAGWVLDGATVRFDVSPAAGAAVRAGFRFDVPVRFAADTLEVSLSTFRAGAAPAVPLIEVREA